MNNNKQSSVEWLFCQLIDKEYKNPHDTELISIIEQAKAMHKEEIMQAWQKGDGVNDKVAYKMSLEYYNETFNK